MTDHDELAKKIKEKIKMLKSCTTENWTDREISGYLAGYFGSDLTKFLEKATENYEES